VNPAVCSGDFDPRVIGYPAVDRFLGRFNATLVPKEDTPVQTDTGYLQAGHITLYSRRESPSIGAARR